MPALVIPTYDVRGEVAFCQIRPDQPRVVKGRVSKYEMPRDSRMVIDVPPRVRPAIGNPHTPLVITEGARKADSAVSAGLNAVDLVGVWTWRGTNGAGGKTALPDFEQIALNGRVVYLAFDSDAMTKHEVHQALERFASFLRGRQADVRFVYLPSGAGGAKTGLDDFLAAGHSRDDVLALATDQLRPLGGEPRHNNGKVTAPPEVDGAELLEAIRTFVARFMVLPSEQVADLLALWVLHTWSFEAAWATPYLRIVSATPDSGKTLLLEVLAVLTRRGWHAINPSTAVLYRKIDQLTPTLLLDEMDNYPMDERRDALSVLNAGYKRGAKVDRCTDTGALESFDAYCPKAYAGLDQKALVSTLLSRSITIRLERKTSAEQVEMWIAPLTEPQAAPLTERCEAWAHHNLDALRGAHPQLPAELLNRAAEVWWALLAIADRVGDDWPARVRDAARTLTAGGGRPRRGGGGGDAAGRRSGRVRRRAGDLHEGPTRGAQRARGTSVGRPAPRRGTRRSWALRPAAAVQDQAEDRARVERERDGKGLPVRPVLRRLRAASAGRVETAVTADTSVTTRAAWEAGCVACVGCDG